MANLLAPLAPKLCGTLIRRYIRCGKKDCKCRRGQLHGPYHYLQFRMFRPGRGWVKTVRYVPKQDVKRVRRELAAARQYSRAQMRREYEKLKARIDSLESYIEGGLENVGKRHGKGK